MINVTGSFSDDMRKYVVTVPPLLTTVEGVENYPTCGSIRV